MNRSQEKHKTILVVDDNSSVRQLFSNFLQASGFMIHEASDGIEALDILDRYRIDAVLSDIRMPRMDGVELLKQLKKCKTKIPIFVLMSGYSEYTHDEIIGLGANALFDKPIKCKEVVSCLKTLLCAEKLEKSCSPTSLKTHTPLEQSLGKKRVQIPETQQALGHVSGVLN